MLSDSHEDSLTLDGYLLITKKEVAKEKRARKEAKRERKSSTQLSIFGWLNQGKLGQHSLLYVSCEPESPLTANSFSKYTATCVSRKQC